MGFLTGDNIYNRLMTKIFDLCLLSILTTICCLPILTAGSALTSMYAVMMKMSKNIEGPIISSYFKEFKSNLKNSFGGSIVLVAGIVILTLDLTLWTQNEVEGRSLFYGLTITLVVLFLSINDWYLAIRARFNESTLQAYVNAIKFGIVFLPVTLMNGVFSVLFVFLVTRYAFLIFFIPLVGIAVLFYPKAILMGKKIDKYISDKKLVPVNEEVSEISADNEESSAASTSSVASVSSAASASSVASASSIASTSSAASADKTDNRSDWKKLSFSDKVSYILYNHIAEIVFFLLLVFIIGGIGANYFFGKDTCKFNLAVVNSYTDKSDMSLSDELNAYYEFDGKKKCAKCDTAYHISYQYNDKIIENPAAETSFFDKFFLNIRNGLIDAAIIPESFYEYCNTQGDIFYDVEYVLSKEQASEYKDLFTSATTDEGIFVNGILIDDCDYLKNSGLKFLDVNSSDSYVLVFPITGGNLEECRRFIEYIKLK
ncbi:MAG: YesL family protein [Lachnospiraceae bacterium]|nr:YesL family protein [Lachnospiraceae bacterium]